MVDIQFQDELLKKKIHKNAWIRTPNGQNALLKYAASVPAQTWCVEHFRYVWKEMIGLGMYNDSNVNSIL